MSSLLYKGGQLPDLIRRAVQYRFLRATGITQSTARQIERARYATFLLQQGVSILDTMQQPGITISHI